MSSWLLLDGWTNRISKEIDSKFSNDPDWIYLGSSVDMAPLLLDLLQEVEKQDLTFAEFQESGPSVDKISDVFGYSRDLPLSADHYVRFKRKRMPKDSTILQGREIMVLEHSRVDFMWAKRCSNT